MEYTFEKVVPEEEPDGVDNEGNENQIYQINLVEDYEAAWPEQERSVKLVRHYNCSV